MTAKEILVIGYGNELRGDDAAGPRVAATVSESGWMGVRAMICHQLTPELADHIAAACAVIFVDAALGLAAGGICAQPVHAGEQSETLAHTADPSSLLALTRALFGRCPPAWRVAIPAANLEFGQSLTPVAQRGVAAALQELRRLCHDLLKNPVSRQAPQPTT